MSARALTHFLPSFALDASFSVSDEGGVSLFEMLYCTSLIALVGAGEQPAFSPRRLRIFNTKTEKVRVNKLSSVALRQSKKTDRSTCGCGMAE